jgi:hypothetical protein
MARFPCFKARSNTVAHIQSVTSRHPSPVYAQGGKHVPVLKRTLLYIQLIPEILIKSTTQYKWYFTRLERVLVK